jgi:hypothetical protein
VHGTLPELAKAKGVSATYVSRILRLTLLAPEIVEAILAELQLEDLLTGFALQWEGQLAAFDTLQETPAGYTAAARLHHVR